MKSQKHNVGRAAHLDHIGAEKRLALALQVVDFVVESADVALCLVDIILLGEEILAAGLAVATEHVDKHSLVTLGPQGLAHVGTRHDRHQSLGACACC